MQIRKGYNSDKIWFFSKVNQMISLPSSQSFSFFFLSYIYWEKVRAQFSRLNEVVYEHEVKISILNMANTLMFLAEKKNE